MYICISHSHEFNGVEREKMKNMKHREDNMGEAEEERNKKPIKVENTVFYTYRGGYKLVEKA